MSATQGHAELYIYAVIAAADDKGRPYFWTLIARKKEMLGLLNCLLSAGEVLSPLRGHYFILGTTPKLFDTLIWSNQFPKENIFE